MAVLEKEVPLVRRLQEKIRCLLFVAFTHSSLTLRKTALGSRKWRG